MNLEREFLKLGILTWGHVEHLSIFSPCVVVLWLTRFWLFLIMFEWESWFWFSTSWFLGVYTVSKCSSLTIWILVWHWGGDLHWFRKHKGDSNILFLMTIFMMGSLTRCLFLELLSCSRVVLSFRAWFGLFYTPWTEFEDYWRFELLVHIHLFFSLWSWDFVYASCRFRS